MIHCNFYRRGQNDGTKKIKLDVNLHHWMSERYLTSPESIRSMNGEKEILYMDKLLWEKERRDMENTKRTLALSHGS